MTSAEMKFITVNPTWNVPPSIIENEYLPALQQDPDALDRIGLKTDAGCRRHRAHLRSRRAPAMRSAASASTSPTSSWSTSTTRRTNICSRATSAPTATAACGCRIRSNYGEKLLSHRAAAGALHARRSCESMFGGSEININFPKNDLGAPDLSDRLRRRGRQAAVPRRRLRPRRQDDRDPQEAASARSPTSRSSGRRTPRPSRCACRSACMAATAAATAAAELLRLPVRRRARRSFGAADLSAPQPAGPRVGNNGRYYFR